MITSKSTLLSSKAVGNDKKNPATSVIHLTGDGDSVACNAKTILIVEGISKDRAEQVPFPGDGEEVSSLVLPVGLVEDIVKVIPTDKTFDGLLELIHLKRDGDEILVTCHDGKSQRTIRGREATRNFIDFRSLLEALWYTKKKKARLVIDRKRLIDTLTAMDKICGTVPSYIEITEDDDIMIRSYIPQTGQRVMALVTGVLGEWLDDGSFENKFRKKKKLELKKKGV